MYILPQNGYNYYNMFSYDFPVIFLWFDKLSSNMKPQTPLDPKPGISQVANKCPEKIERPQLEEWEVKS